MLSVVGSEKQEREHPVPCKECGCTIRAGRLVPRTMTWNTSGKCDTHQEKNDTEFFQKIEEFRRDFD